MGSWIRGSLSGSLGELPESASEGFYFSGLGGLGGGTERRISENLGECRRNGMSMVFSLRRAQIPLCIRVQKVPMLVTEK